MNPFSIIKYQLYLLQIENNEIGRYWRLLFGKGYFKSRQPLQKSLNWTAKAKLILLLSLVFWASCDVALFSFSSKPLALAGAILLFLFFPAFYSIILLLMIPLDWVVKFLVIGKARRLIKNSGNLKIIGIAGSYGKTTMKNLLVSVLGQKIKLITPGGNTNTALGISSWLLKNSLKNTEVLLIEFGEEYQGDNKRIAGIFPPDIVVITGVSEAHFERIGNIENIAATIFESVEGSKPKAQIYLNSDDENIVKNYQKYVGGREVHFYGQKSEFKVTEKKFDQQKLSWSAEVQGFGRIEASFLAEYIISDITLCVMIARSLGLSDDEIKRGLIDIKPVEHRLQPIKSKGNVLVIDDSYNANPVGVEEAIRVLGRFDGKRKIYITPGIVESGQKNKEIHTKIGHDLAKVADKVILIKNSATPFIDMGLEEKGFKKEDIIWFDTADEAHKSLGNILKPGDVILFQNDWGDQYL
jgi:UDP-N-acetylmuramoyl-tripeptide--D-alanyl-D-alanine ligase